MASWWTTSLGELERQYAVDVSRGLTSEEAQRRLERAGPNKLPRGRHRTLPALFFSQFKSPLIYVLLLAAGFMVVIGQRADALVVFVVLSVNAAVGAVQEGRAQQTLQALKKFIQTNATVLRDGMEVVVADREVVVGDVLILREGEKIAADARLVEAENLRLDESALTGESTPTAKQVGLLRAEQVPVTKRSNMVFQGTHVSAGSGLALVVATGMSSEIGKISIAVAYIDTETPLKREFELLSQFILKAVLAISISLFVVGVLLGKDPTQMFFLVTSLAVSIIPEGLPVVLTLILASGVWRMARQHALVKKLPAVETLGRATVIAVDKTGTITRNEMTVRRANIGGKIFTVAGVGYNPTGAVTFANGMNARLDKDVQLAARIVALSSRASIASREHPHTTMPVWKISGDPTEAALVVFSQKLGLRRDELERMSALVSELPFDFQRKFHACLHEVKEGYFLSISGAPEPILSASVKTHVNGKAVPLTQKRKQDIEAAIHEMSSGGFRIVGCAYAVIPKQKASPVLLNAHSIGELTFLGHFGLEDAIRPEVPQTLARAREANMNVVMITGDHAATAAAIAKQAGILTDGQGVVSGLELDQMQNADIGRVLSTARVFARVTPEHKLKIVEAYRRNGDVVAMTGDGVNDAPSLVAADLGVAMGSTGTPVAQEAADIILLDDNFATIIVAIEEGRNIYVTIKKVLLYLFSTSAAEVLTLFVSLLVGLPAVLLPIQILWLNLVTDGFLDVALAFEPKERNLLSRTHPRRIGKLFDSQMTVRMIIMALSMMAGSLGLFVIGYHTSLLKAWTMCLTGLAVFQWLNAWNCRTDTESLFSTSLTPNPFLIGATGIVLVLQLIAIYTPRLERFLHLTPLSIAEWLVILSIASTVLIIEEFRKYIYRRRLTVLS